MKMSFLKQLFLLNFLVKNKNNEKKNLISKLKFKIK